MTDREAIDVLFNEWKCIDRNDGIHCDRKCESCDLVMDVEIIREAFNKAISALHAQDSPKPTAESVQNVQNEDLILRNAAIEALGERPMVWTDDDQYALGERNQYDMNRLAIETLPPAQPEPHWIPVSERLPEENVPVLLGVRFKDDFKFFVSARIDYNYWSGLGREIKGELRWMPLPEPYRVERRTDDANDIT